MEKNLPDEINFKTGIYPCKEEIMTLYSDAGWHAYTSNPDLLMRGIKNSLLVYTAWVDNELAGLARIVGDGNTIIYIQDILVLGKYRRMGIGRTLMRMIKDQYTHVRQIVLMTDNNNETHGFYTSVGFSPADENGCRAYLQNKGE